MTPEGNILIAFWLRTLTMDHHWLSKPPRIIAPFINTIPSPGIHGD
jgi:hypothetical protein